MRLWAMYDADVDNDVWGPVVMTARQQDPSFKVLHAGLKAQLAT